MIGGMEALNRAIELVGGVGQLAERLATAQSTVSNWRARQRVPAKRCREIERVTEGRVTRYELRPDVFGNPHS